MKKRLISELKKHILILGIGAAYYLWVVATSLYIPCVFKVITGLKCPGCGVTHMIVALSRLDFIGAFNANQLLFVLLPIAAIVYAVREIYFIRTGGKMKRGRMMRFFEWALLASAMVFWVLRNLPLV